MHIIASAIIIIASIFGAPISAPMMSAHTLHASRCAEDAIEYRESMRAPSSCIAIEIIAGSLLGRASESMIDYCGSRNVVMYGGRGGPYGRCIDGKDSSHIEYQ